MACIAPISPVGRPSATAWVLPLQILLLPPPELEVSLLGCVVEAHITSASRWSVKGEVVQVLLHPEQTHVPLQNSSSASCPAGSLHPSAGHTQLNAAKAHSAVGMELGCLRLPTAHGTCCGENCNDGASYLRSEEGQSVTAGGTTESEREGGGRSLDAAPANCADATSSLDTLQRAVRSSGPLNESKQERAILYGIVIGVLGVLLAVFMTYVGA